MILSGTAAAVAKKTLLRDRPVSRHIELSVCRDVRRAPHVNHGTRHDKSAAKLRERVIAQGRFGRRCWFCDFAFGNSELFELHHVDGDHSNEAIDNVVPSCEMCHAAFGLDLVSRKWKEDAGKIIFLPELSQAHLNNLLQAVFFAIGSQVVEGERSVALGSDGSTAPSLAPHTVLRRLQARAEQVEKSASGEVVRGRLSEPTVLARILQDMSDTEYSRRGELLVGLRYMPPADYFVSQAGAWTLNGAAFSRVDLSAWASVADAGNG